MHMPLHIRVPIAAAALVVVAGCSTGASPTQPPMSPGPPGGSPSDTVALLEDFSSRQVFPADNWWNLDISGAPVDSQSQALIDWISGRTPQNPTATRIVHPDFGPPPYGIPYVGVGANQALMTVTFAPYGSQSDAGAPGRPPGTRFRRKRGPSPTTSRARLPAAARAATGI